MYLALDWRSSSARATSLADRPVLRSTPARQRRRRPEVSGGPANRLSIKLRSISPKVGICTGISIPLFAVISAPLRRKRRSNSQRLVGTAWRVSRFAMRRQPSRILLRERLFSNSACRPDERVIGRRPPHLPDAFVGGAAWFRDVRAAPAETPSQPRGTGDRRPAHNGARPLLRRGHQAGTGRAPELDDSHVSPQPWRRLHRASPSRESPACPRRVEKCTPRARSACRGRTAEHRQPSGRALGRAL
jgi:hypothetical protein